MRWWHWLLVGVVLLKVGDKISMELLSLPGRSASIISWLGGTAFFMPFLLKGLENDYDRHIPLSYQIVGWIVFTTAVYAYPFLFRTTT